MDNLKNFVQWLAGSALMLTFVVGVIVGALGALAAVMAVLHMRLF